MYKSACSHSTFNLPVSGSIVDMGVVTWLGGRPACTSRMGHKKSLQPHLFLLLTLYWILFVLSVGLSVKVVTIVAGSSPTMGFQGVFWI